MGLDFQASKCTAKSNRVEYVISQSSGEFDAYGFDHRVIPEDEVDKAYFYVGRFVDYDSARCACDEHLAKLLAQPLLTVVE